MCFLVFKVAKFSKIFGEKSPYFIHWVSNQDFFFWRIFAPWQQKKGACNLYKGLFSGKFGLKLL
jgi:hypothetical protein